MTELKYALMMVATGAETAIHGIPSVPFKLNLPFKLNSPKASTSKKLGALGNVLVLGNVVVGTATTHR